MNKKLTQIIGWFTKHSPKEQAVILTVSALITYVVWGLVIDGPLLGYYQRSSEKLTVLQKQIEDAKKQIVDIEAITKDPNYAATVEKQKVLTNQSKNVKQQIMQILPNLTAEKDIPHLLDDIYHPQLGVSLIHLKKLAPESWAPFKLTHVDLPENLRHIIQHKFEIQLSGSYFDIMRYFSYIEKLPWHIYWESLDYKVIKYPDAKVDVVAYILTSQS